MFEKFFKKPERVDRDPKEYVEMFIVPTLDELKRKDGNVDYAMKEIERTIEETHRQEGDRFPVDEVRRITDQMIAEIQAEALHLDVTQEPDDAQEDSTPEEYKQAA